MKDEGLRISLVFLFSLRIWSDFSLWAELMRYVRSVLSWKLASHIEYSAEAGRGWDSLDSCFFDTGAASVESEKGRVSSNFFKLSITIEVSAEHLAEAGGGWDSLDPCGTATAAEGRL